MKRALLQGEIIIKKWGTLTLTNHRLWIEAGDTDNYFLNSLDLHHIDGHSIVKYSDTSTLYLGVASFIMSPAVALGMRMLLKDLGPLPSYATINGLAFFSGFVFLMLGANFIYKYRSSKSLTLNFNAGHKQLYFKLTGEYARVEHALEFANQVDAETKKLSTYDTSRTEDKKFKIAD